LRIFETQRLTVRRYTINDKDIFYLFSGNEEVMRYIRPVITKAESDQFLADNIQLYNTYPHTGRWAAFEKASGSFVGSFSILVMDAGNNKLHIGYALLPQYWGKGYATELLKQGMAYFFDKHTATELYAITQLPNIASQRVLLKAGFRQTGTLTEREHEALVFTFCKDELLKDE
jgi:ribosomal-protein-alanine N-acetyltransferase